MNWTKEQVVPWGISEFSKVTNLRYLSYLNCQPDLFKLVKNDRLLNFNVSYFHHIILLLKSL